MPKKQTQQGASAKARQTAAARRSGPSARSTASPTSSQPASRTGASTAVPRTSKANPKPAKAAPAKKSSAKAKAAPRKRTDGPSPLRTLRWWLLPAGVFVVLALFVLAYYPVARVQYHAVRTRSKLEAELASIEARNQRLTTRVARLKTSDGVEVEAREQLGMVKKGESLGIVLDGDEQPTTRAAPRIDSDEVTTAPAGPWTAFLDAIFGVSP